MAVEGGSSYRDRLVKREQNKKNLIDLRKRQSENPMEWVNQLRRGEAEQAYESYAKTAASMGLSPEAYGAFIDAAFQAGGNMEGLISPAITNTNVNLQTGRALEGLKSVAPEKAPLSKAGFAADSKRQQRFGGALTGIMQQYGDQRFMLNKQEKAQQNVEMLKDIAKYAKEDPSSFASSMALGFIAPFANIAAEPTGNNDVYDFIKRTKGIDGKAGVKDAIIGGALGFGPMSPWALISPGDVIANESMFRDYSKPEDYVYAGMSLTPSQWARAAMLPVKAGRFGVSTAVRGIENVATKGVPVPVPFGAGGFGVMRVGGKASRARNRVEEARAESGWSPARPTPELTGLTRFGGAETRKLPWEEVESRQSSAAEFAPEGVIKQESDILSSYGYSSEGEPASAIFARDLSREELVKKTKDALRSIKVREKQTNDKRVQEGKEPFAYEDHFDPEDLTHDELITLWGNNPLYVYDEAGNIIPSLGAALGHGIPLSSGGSATLGNVGGQRIIGNVRWGAS